MASLSDSLGLSGSIGLGGFSYTRPSCVTTSGSSSAAVPNVIEGHAGTSNAGPGRRRGGFCYTAMEAQDLQDHINTETFFDRQISSDAVTETETEASEIAESKALSSSRPFQHAVGVVIGLNTLLIAVEAAYIRHEDLKGIFLAVEMSFTLVYVLELAIRLYELGMQPFFSGADWPWNSFDFVITMSGILDAILGAMGKGGVGASAGRLFRVLRILRLFRALKFLKSIDYVIATAAKATLKLALLVMLVVFVSSIVFTNCLWDAPDDEVRDSFGDLGASMWTMFTLMTLENWTAIVGPVLAIKPYMRVPIVLFIFLGSIALMSLVPAIFIELNMTEREDAEKREQDIKKQRLSKVRRRSIEHHFKEADRDRDGRVSFEELIELLQFDGPAFYKSEGAGHHGLRAEDLDYLRLGAFDLYERKLGDADSDLDFSMQEFCDAVMRSFNDVDFGVLWCGVTNVRQQVAELAEIVKGELPTLRKAAADSLAKAQDTALDELRAEMASLRDAVLELQGSGERTLKDPLGTPQSDKSGPSDFASDCGSNRESSEQLALLQQELAEAQASMQAAQMAELAATVQLTELQLTLKSLAADCFKAPSGGHSPVPDEEEAGSSAAPSVSASASALSAEATLGDEEAILELAAAALAMAPPGVREEGRSALFLSGSTAACTTISSSHSEKGPEALKHHSKVLAPAARKDDPASRARGSSSFKGSIWEGMDGSSVVELMEPVTPEGSDSIAASHSSGRRGRQRGPEGSNCRSSSNNSSAERYFDNLDWFV